MRKIVSLFLVLAGLVFLPQIVFAASDEKPKIHDEAYSAKFVSQTPADPITIEAGKAKTVVLKFKNTGTTAWNASGARYISAYTMEPRNRISVFRGSDWKNGKQTPGISNKTKPGEVAELAFQLHAPAKAGEYTENFYLAAEGHSWVKDGGFFLKIRVVNSKVPPLVGEGEGGVSPVNTPTVKANRFIQTVKQISVAGGAPVDVIVGFQNLGSAPWKGYRFIVQEKTTVAGEGQSPPSFADPSWESSNVILSKTSIVDPSRVLRETIRFRAPAKRGTYTAEFHLEVDGQVVESPDITIPVTVTEDAPPDYLPPWGVAPEQKPEEGTPAPRISTEPTIRVGIWKPETYVQVQPQDDDYGVYDGANKVGVLPRNRIGVLQYAKGTYSYRGVDLDFSTENYIRLVPETNPHAVFMLLNINRRIKWKGGSRNFDRYRGTMEYRVTQDGKAVYVIDELLLEDYVAGIGESSNIAPYEYIKALQTAARTYAYYIQQNTDKHDKRNFDVVAHTGDQLYIGVVNEEIAPRVLAASQDTRGYMVTYGGNVVITPYFGNSDTRTRSWTEVWGGAEKPWLVSVPTTYDKRDHRKKKGHGVGMAQRDAALRADEEGALWQDLLKYYYTGVDVERMYQ